MNFCRWPRLPKDFAISSILALSIMGVYLLITSLLHTLLEILLENAVHANTVQWPFDKLIEPICMLHYDYYLNGAYNFLQQRKLMHTTWAPTTVRFALSLTNSPVPPLSLWVLLNTSSSDTGSPPFSMTYSIQSESGIGIEMS